jgi:transposase-like protein
MSEKIVQLNEEVIKGQIKELVRGSVEETLNGLLEAEAQKLTQAARYERSEERQAYRSGHYQRNLSTSSGDVTLNVPRLKGVTFDTTHFTGNVDWQATKVGARSVFCQFCYPPNF